MKTILCFTILLIGYFHSVNGDEADDLIAKLLQDPHSRQIIEQGNLNYDNGKSLDMQPPMHMLRHRYSFRSGDATINDQADPPSGGDVPPQYKLKSYRGGDAPPNYRVGSHRGGDVPPPSYRGGDSSNLNDVPPHYRASAGYRSGDEHSKEIPKEDVSSPKDMDSLLSELKVLIEDTLENDKKELFQGQNPHMAIPWKKEENTEDPALPLKRSPPYNAIPWKKNAEDPAIPLKKEVDPSSTFAMPWRKELDPSHSFKQESPPPNFAVPWKKEINKNTDPALPLKKEVDPAIPLKREPALPLKKDADPALPLKRTSNIAWKRDLYNRLINDINELFQMSDIQTKKSKDDVLTDDLSSIFKK